MVYKNYGGHNYYMELVSVKQILKEVDDGENCRLCNNGIQGDDAVDILQKLSSITSECFVDCDGDFSDTILFKIKEDFYKELLKIVAQYQPDEMSEANENYWRMWWD